MRERVVGVAQWAVDQGDAVLVTLGLGSCVAVVLYDAQARVGALLHLLLPSPKMSRDHSNPGRFAETAVPLALAEMEAAGAQRDRLAAWLVGGASMFGAASATIAMGERIVAAARQALASAHVPLVAEDVLEHHGRSVYFHLDDGRIEVRTVAHGSRTL
jgi:chemotaxis protein CheD